MFALFRRGRKVETKVSPHQLLVHRIDLIRNERIGRVFSPDKSIIGIRVPFRGIKEYSNYLRQLAAALSQNRELGSYFFQQSISSIPIRDWFVDSSGHYVDLEKETTVFQEASKKFLLSYIELEEKNDQLAERKLIQTGVVVSQIKEVVDALIDITAFQTNGSAIRSEPL